MTPGEVALFRILGSIARSVRGGKLAEWEVERGIWLQFNVWGDMGLIALRRVARPLVLERVEP